MHKKMQIYYSKQLKKYLKIIIFSITDEYFNSILINFLVHMDHVRLVSARLSY